MIVRTKPNVYPRKALLKYWLSFALDTSNRRANATKIPEKYISLIIKLGISWCVMQEEESSTRAKSTRKDEA